MKNINELIEQYAQRCVDDMDIDVLMNLVKESIEARLQDLPDVEIINEITASVYPELTEEKA